MVDLVVRPSVDSAFLAWRAPFMDDCRGFALARRIRRAAGSAPSPQTYKAAGEHGFAEEWVSSWVGFGNGPETHPGESQPTTVWPIQKYLWSDFMVNPGDSKLPDCDAVRNLIGDLVSGGWERTRAPIVQQSTGHPDPARSLETARTNVLTCLEHRGCSTDDDALPSRLPSLTFDL